MSSTGHATIVHEARPWLEGQSASQSKVITAMRAWILDCEWQDLDADEVEELTEAQVVHGVSRHYAGGVAAFLEESAR